MKIDLREKLGSAELARFKPNRDMWLDFMDGQNRGIAMSEASSSATLHSCFSLSHCGVASAHPRVPVLDVWVQLRDEEDHRTLRTLGLNFVESEDGDWRRFHGEPAVAGPLRESGIPYRLAVSPLTRRITVITRQRRWSRPWKSWLMLTRTRPR